MSQKVFDRSKEPFDRSKRFTVFGSWMENFVKLEKYGAEVPYALFKGIATYSMHGDVPDFSDVEINGEYDNDMICDMLTNVFVAMKPNIDTSVKNSRANFADVERNERENLVTQFKHDHPDVSTRDIEYATGVSKSTVSRILKKAKKNETLDQVQQQDEAETDEADDSADDSNELPF